MDICILHASTISSSVAFSLPQATFCLIVSGNKNTFCETSENSFLLLLNSNPQKNVQKAYIDHRFSRKTTKQFKIVVFPSPEPPTKAICSPASIEKLIPFKNRMLLAGIIRKINILPLNSRNCLIDFKFLCILPSVRSFFVYKFLVFSLMQHQLREYHLHKKTISPIGYKILLSITVKPSFLQR